MKPNTFFSLAFVLSFTALVPAQHTYEIGQRSMALKDPSRNRPLVTEIWYPTRDALDRQDSIPENIPFVRITTIPNANIPNQKFPLLLVSHGTGGNRFSLTWFVEKMVKEGYIVVAMDHYGNTSFNKIPREFLKWWERAIDMQFVLTQILQDAHLGKHVDTDKIGGVGFSLGGYTNLALAGGYADRTSMGKQMDLPPEFPKSGEVIHFETDSLLVNSFKTHADQVKDERIKAFFVMAPALGSGFRSKTQTETITAPIFIVAGKGDTNTPITSNALVYHRLVPTSELYLFNEHVDHYVFLNEGTEFGKQILPQLTMDHPSVNRKEIHDKTLNLAISFFKQQL